MRVTWRSTWSSWRWKITARPCAPRWQNTASIYIDPVFKARLPLMSEDEDVLLDGSLHRTEDSRLSCQISVTDSLDGMKITVAPEN
jgi:hypothetical protein